MAVKGMVSLLESAAKFTAFSENIKLAKQATLAEIAIMVRDEAKAALGTYKYRWQHLADSTHEDRLRKENPGSSCENPFRKSISYGRVFKKTSLVCALARCARA